VLVLAPQGGAGATPHGGGPGGPGYWPDSADHWFCFESNVPSADYPIYQDAFQYLDNVTSMYDSQSSYCGSLTDVIISNTHPIPGCSNCLGMAPCIAKTGFLNLACEQGMEYVDTTNIWIASGGFSGDINVYWFNVIYNARHELGHTAGMGHSTNSPSVHVMAQGFYTDYGNWARWGFRSEDTCHVNEFFGGPACNH